MGFAQEMENLGQQMISSFDKRMSDVKRTLSSSHALTRKLRSDNNSLFKQTHDFLRNFRSEHKDMSRKQRQTLMNFAKQLHNSETNGQKERAKFCRNISQNVEKYLGECDKEQNRTHDECLHAHKNFQRAMREIERHRAAVKLPTYHVAREMPETSGRPRASKKRGRKKRR